MKVITAPIDSIFSRQGKGASTLSLCPRPLNFRAWRSVCLLPYLNLIFSEDMGVWIKLTETRAKQKRWSRQWPVLRELRRVSQGKRDSGRSQTGTRTTWPRGEFRAVLVLTERCPASSRSPALQKLTCRHGRDWRCQKRQGVSCFPLVALPQQWYYLTLKGSNAYPHFIFNFDGWKKAPLETYSF